MTQRKPRRYRVAAEEEGAGEEDDSPSVQRLREKCIRCVFCDCIWLILLLIV